MGTNGWTRQRSTEGRGAGCFSVESISSSRTGQGGKREDATTRTGRRAGTSLHGREKAGAPARVTDQATYVTWTDTQGEREDLNGPASHTGHVRCHSTPSGGAGGEHRIVGVESVGRGNTCQPSGDTLGQFLKSSDTNPRELQCSWCASEHPHSCGSVSAGAPSSTHTPASVGAGQESGRICEAGGPGNLVRVDAAGQETQPAGRAQGSKSTVGAGGGGPVRPWLRGAEGVDGVRGGGVLLGDRNALSQRCRDSCPPVSSLKIVAWPTWVSFMARRVEGSRCVLGLGQCLGVEGLSGRWLPAGEGCGTSVCLPPLPPAPQGWLGHVREQPRGTGTCPCLITPEDKGLSLCRAEPGLHRRTQGCSHCPLAPRGA